MRFAWLSMRKDLLRYMRDPVALGLWLLLPVVLALLVLAVFGNAYAKPHGILLIADEDNGLAGVVLRESIARGPLKPLLTAQSVEREAGQALMNRGKASAMVIIPKGFDNAVLRNEGSRVTVISNPEQTFLPAVIRDAVAQMLDGAHYLQQSHGSPAGFVDYFLPPRIRLKTTETGDPDKPVPTVIQILFPGIVMLVAMLMASGMSLEIWKEFHAGAFSRARLVRGGLTAFLAGKLGANALVLLTTLVLTFGLVQMLFGIPMRSFAMAIAWAECAAISIYCAMLCVQLWFAAEQSSTTAAGILLVPMGMLGGEFVPFEAMPQSLAQAARWTPTGWMLTNLQAILDGSAVPVEVAIRALILAGSALALFVLVRLRLERRLAS